VEHNSPYQMIEVVPNNPCSHLYRYEYIAPATREYALALSTLAELTPGTGVGFFLRQFNFTLQNRIALWSHSFGHRHLVPFP